ncbi:MAG: sulfotransferase [Bacteroidia bacterium]|nr:sulfotransferase [Bacteroidia bacterium]
MKNLLKSLIRKISAVFFSRLQPHWEEVRKAVEKESFEKLVENVGPDLEMEEIPSVSMPRMLALGEGVKMGRRINLESEGGIILGDHVQLEDGVCIESIEKERDIPSFDIVHPDFMKPVVIGEGAYIGRNTTIMPGSIIPGGSLVQAGSVLSGTHNFPKRKTTSSNSKGKNALGFGDKLFFVASTGRSGTKTISALLSQHPDIDCRHEAQFALNNLSTLMAEGESSELVEAALKVMYLQSANIKTTKKVYGESDLKNSSLIPGLHKILPEAKFIWLIRKAEDFVASAYGRGWFDQREYCYGEEKTFSPDSMISENDMNMYRWEYARHRVNGGKTEGLEKETWEKMGAFERCCWYWGYWNQMIEKQLIELRPRQYFFLRLEEIEEQLPAILEWLGVKEAPIQSGVFNRASHKKVKSESWSEEQKRVFEKWCREGMNKWYGND